MYRITAWLPAGSSFRHDFPRGIPVVDRWEFVGTVAEDAIRNKYLSRSVDGYFSRHGQNPILYVNC